MYLAAVPPYASFFINLGFTIDSKVRTLGSNANKLIPMSLEVKYGHNLNLFSVNV